MITARTGCDHPRRSSRPWPGAQRAHSLHHCFKTRAAHGPIRLEKAERAWQTQQHAGLLRRAFVLEPARGKDCKAAEAALPCGPSTLRARLLHFLRGASDSSHQCDPDAALCTSGEDCKATQAAWPCGTSALRARLLHFLRGASDSSHQCDPDAALCKHRFRVGPLPRCSAPDATVPCRHLALPTHLVAHAVQEHSCLLGDSALTVGSGAERV